MHGWRRPANRLLRGLAQRSLLLRMAGALNDLQFTGDDFSDDKDVCSIVLKCPTLSWGRKRLASGPGTLIPATSAGGDGSADRGARHNKLPFDGGRTRLPRGGAVEMPVCCVSRMNGECGWVDAEEASRWQRT